MLLKYTFLFSFEGCISWYTQGELPFIWHIWYEADSFSSIELWAHIWFTQLVENLIDLMVLANLDILIHLTAHLHARSKNFRFIWLYWFFGINCVGSWQMMNCIDDCTMFFTKHIDGPFYMVLIVCVRCFWLGPFPLVCLL